MKYLERLTTFQRGHDIDAGAGAVVEYEQFMADNEPGPLDRIATYNEDDVRATQALRDWLIDHRPVEIPWRAAQLEPPPGIPDLDEHVAQLHAFGPDTPEHLLGDLLGYWLREWLAYIAPKTGQISGRPDDAVRRPETSWPGCTPPGWSSESVRGASRSFRSCASHFPPRSPTASASQGGQVVYLTPDGMTRYADYRSA